MNAERNEDLRRAVLEVLAPRHPVALGAAAIARRIRTEELVDGEVADHELLGPLEFLRGMEPPLVERIESGLGASTAWRATVAGVLAFEKGI